MNLQSSRRRRRRTHANLRGGAFPVVVGRRRRQRRERERREGVGAVVVGGSEDGADVGTRAALEMLGGGSRRVGGGEDGIAEGALELDGLGVVGARVADENGLQVRPVPGAFPLYCLSPNGDQAFVALVQRLRRQVVRRREGVGGAGIS